MSTPGTKIFGKEPQHCCTTSTSPLDLLLFPPPWAAHILRQKLVGFCDLGRPKFRKILKFNNTAKDNNGKVKLIPKA